MTIFRAPLSRIILSSLAVYVVAALMIDDVPMIEVLNAVAFAWRSASWSRSPPTRGRPCAHPGRPART